MAAGTRMLSEARSKELLRPYGVPFAPELTARDPSDAVGAADELGYPVVVKLCGDGIAHKTERGLVRLALPDAAAVRIAAEELLGAATPADGDVTLLVAPMLTGSRELMAGLTRDSEFGMTVVVGLGGILTEALGDVSIRLVPIQAFDASEMLDDLSAKDLLDEFRGEPSVDRTAMQELLLGLSRVAVEHPELVSADLNPLLVVQGRPVAVDALVEVRSGTDD